MQFDLNKAQEELIESQKEPIKKVSAMSMNIKPKRNDNFRSNSGFSTHTNFKL